MHIEMQSAPTVAGLTHGRWDVAIIGSSLDDRGTSGATFARDCAAEVVSVRFDPDDLQIAVGEARLQSDDLAEWLRDAQAKSLLFEATTLGFSELLLFLHAAHSAHVASVSVLYVEPGEYNAPARGDVLNRRDFDLSSEILGFSGIPGWASILDEKKPQKVCFFLGYEGQRLDQAFEQLGIVANQCTAILGVPSFQAGWEMDTFANNIRVVRERQIGGGIAFCPADNPAAVYDYLLGRYRRRDADEQLFVAPLGTKPHAIGVAVFACRHPDIGVLFDHPRPREKRSKKVGKWHLFDVRCDIAPPA